MKKILVIPDVHLRGWMFEEADKLMKEQEIDQAVCLGDLVDDWGQQENHAAYESLFQKVFEFDKEHPNTLWCYGNHDISYTWKKYETGYSSHEEEYVRSMFSQMRKMMKERLNFCHVIGKCMFTHAGITWEFLDDLRYRGFKIRGIRSIEDVRDIVNQCGEKELWRDESPIWARPEGSRGYVRPFMDYDCLQIVGHTPVKTNYMSVDKYNYDQPRMQNIYLCDCFSTYQDGTPIGVMKYPVISEDGKQIEEFSSSFLRDLESNSREEI